MRSEVSKREVARSAALPVTNSKAVQNFKHLRERQHVRSLTVKQSIQQFIQLVQFAEKLPRWGNLRKLRQFETEELIRWKKRIDALRSGKKWITSTCEHG